MRNPVSKWSRKSFPVRLYNKELTKIFKKYISNAAFFTIMKKKIRKNRGGVFTEDAQEKNAVFILFWKQELKR